MLMALYWFSILSLISGKKEIKYSVVAIVVNSFRRVESDLIRVYLSIILLSS